MNASIAKLDIKKSPLKDKPLHTPGQSLSTEIHDLKIQIFGFAVIIGFAVYLMFNEWSGWYWHTPHQPIAATIIALPAMAFCWIKLGQIQKRIKNSTLGRDGEIKVGQTLEKLRKNGYGIFHDVIGKGFNIDHVVVSPNGIFAIETKTRSKPANTKAKVVFDGQSIVVTGCRPDDHPLKQVINNADWLAKTLKESTGREFPVKPVVVFPGWWVEQTVPIRRIWVLNPDQLEWRIPHEPVSLTQEEMQMVAFHLSRIAINPA